MDKSAHIKAVLDSLALPYRWITHEPKQTIKDCLNTPEIQASPGIMPRNILLCNRQQTAFYLLLMAPLAPFRTAVVSKLLGVSRLSFAKEEHLPALLGLLPGAVSPLGLLFDTQKQVQLVVDASLLDAPTLWFHPGINTASVELITRDFLDTFLPATGHQATIIRLPDPENT